MNARKVLRWIGISFGGIVGLALLGTTIVYIVIGTDLSKTFDVPLTEVAVPVDCASYAEGQRLARTRGCFNGCHGDTVTGDVFFEVPDGTVLVSPDLAAAAKKYSAAELERIIRHGVRPDGTSVLLPMPSEMFYNLSDVDVGSIIGFLQSQTPREEPLPQTYFGPLARVMLLLFKQDTGTILAAESIDHDLARLDASPGDPEEYGKYLAMTSCTECHGPELRGWPDDNVPSLAIVAAYSLEDFTTLLRTGEPIGDRELDLMAEVATQRFSHFTGQEIAALHAYLRTLASS
jgi:cytochrome c553